MAHGLQDVDVDDPQGTSPPRFDGVEFHCHGIGPASFSAFDALDLRRLQTQLELEHVACIPTVYMPYGAVNSFEALLRRYAELRSDGLVPNIIGFAVEGPVLASFGGTPQSGVWLPTRKEWERLASWGSLGLEYFVVSPDFALPGSPFADLAATRQISVEWVVNLLLQHGVRPALGHFTKTDPPGSAAMVDTMVGAARETLGTPSGDALVTDHLFNDMPLEFKHVWRGPEERARRQAEMQAMSEATWDLNLLTEQLGPVPAALIRAARSSDLTICMNFDGEHVDLEFCRRAFGLLGGDRLIAMTDRTDLNELGGQHLHKKTGSTLWYQEGDIVAAGSQHLARQRQNMRSIGIDELSIRAMTWSTPARVLGLADGLGFPAGASPATTP